MLFFKECRKTIRSFTFWIYCMIVALFFFTQYYADCSQRDEAPRPGQEDYGYKIVEDHDLTMYKALNTLTEEYASNRYVCYPFGFYKGVRLKEEKQKKVEEYILESSGAEHSDIEELIKNGQLYNVDHGASSFTEYELDPIDVSAGMTYDRFVDIMEDIDDLLGGGSQYETDSLIERYSRVPMDYEDAVEEYDDFTEKDGVTGSLARYFSDYMGIVLAIMPVFVAAAFVAADRKSRMTGLIYARRISSFRLVLTRYAALVFTMFVPVLIMIVIAFLQALIVYNGDDIYMTAMFTLPVFWLLPNIMEAAAAGVLFTELFSGGTAIIVQFVWWYLSLMTGSAGLSGKIGRFTLICRHNTPYRRMDFLMRHDQFVFNRIFYMLLSLAMIMLAVLIYDMKRGGRFNGIRLFGEGGILRRKK